MALNRQKEDVLLAWINSLRLTNPVNGIKILQDGILFLKLIHKLKGREVLCLEQTIQERLAFVSDFLQSHCQRKAHRGAIISWDNILNGKNLDMELSKVVVLLMCHAIDNELLVTDKLDYKTEVQMAAVLGFALDNENDVFLSDSLEEFLQKPFTVGLPCNSSNFGESPVLNRSRRPDVKFLELMTVASSSSGSPIQEVVNTPQFQLRKLRRQLAEERDARDELERELANSSQLVSEREIQISQLQHKLQRLIRDTALEQDQWPKELEELQTKNEGLLKNLHEVLKQCQDLKSNKSQIEKKIDQLTEENGNLSASLRNMVSQMKSARNMVATLTNDHQAAHEEWERKRLFLDTELCRAVSEKESLSEQIQIMRGKISILEDELKKAQAQTQEQGEVMGPIMERERLNQEISELTCKLSQLQEIILQLEKEKEELQSKHEMEENKFESEISHLQGLISELQETLCVLRGERESLEQISREQQATMTAKISSMNAQITHLSEMIRQKELVATALSQQVAEEQKQWEALKGKMETQDLIHQETIRGLRQEVEHLGTTLKSKEEENSHQQAILQEASESAIQERDTVSMEFNQFRQAKEEEVFGLNQQIRQLEEQREVELSLLSDLRKEKEELDLKSVLLESAVGDLQNKLEVESQKHRETLAAKLQKHSQMESEITELGNRVQQLLMDIKLMGQQLNEAQQEKVHAESCVEELKTKCSELSNALSAERDRNLHLVEKKAAEVEMLSADVRTKTEEVSKLIKDSNRYLEELEATRTAKTNMESHLNSVIEKHQAEICTLHLELTSVQELVKQKEAEKELFQNEVSTKEEELKIQQGRVLYLEGETARMEELQQNLEEEEKRHQMAKQDSDARNKEAQLLRLTLEEKEDKINTLLQNIQALEEKACVLQDVRNKEVEDYKKSFSELEQRLAASQAQILEKNTAFEIQGQQASSLQKDLALEQARAVSLEENLKGLESALRNQKMQEEELRGEAIICSEELNRQKVAMDKLQQEILQLQEEKQEAERKVVIATEKTDALQAEFVSASSLAAERNTSLEHMKKEFTAVSIDADARNKEAQLLRLTLEEKEDKINTLLQNIQALEEKACVLQDVRNKEVEDYKKSFSEMEQRLAESQAQILEKNTAFEIQGQQASSLQKDLALEQARAVSLEENLKGLESALRNQKMQEEELRGEAIVCSEELNRHKVDMEKLQQEILQLQEEKQEAERKVVIATEKTDVLQAEFVSASSLAAERNTSLEHMKKEFTAVSIELNCLKEREMERNKLAEADVKKQEEAMEKLQRDVLSASGLASERQHEIQMLQTKVSSLEKDLEGHNLRLQVAEAQEAQCREFEQKIIRLHEELQHASSLVIQKQQTIETLNEELRRRDVCQEKDVVRRHSEELNKKEMEETISNLKAKLLSASTQEENATKLQQQMAALRHTNEELLTIREGLQKELQLAREELSAFRRLREEMAEGSRLNSDLREQLSEKSEALEHYKAQVENAKIHYNGKKQQLLAANEKIQALTTAQETCEQEVKTLSGQVKVLQQELDQAKATEKNLLLSVNSLQAQLHYADKELREQKKLGKCEEVKAKETVYQKVTEQRQDTSADSLDLSLEDSLNSTRRPSQREDSSTPVLRSSERLKAKRRACGGESLETLYFTPMSVRNAVDGKLESSITSLGGLALDSAKKTCSARRRTTQIINITMTKKTPGRVEGDPDDSFTSAVGLQSAQSFPNLADQKRRPFSLEFSEATTADQLRNLPGYRRSAAHGGAAPRSISSFRVGAENEPDGAEEWMRIAELQARNKACLPHLKSSYPLESRPSLSIPSFTITDDDLKTGDPNETIRRASMMPSQIKESLASHRLSMLPSQIHDGPLSHSETMPSGHVGSRAASQHGSLRPKRSASNAPNARAATLPLKRSSSDLQGPGTPEAKKVASCFPLPMTSQNSQNRSPNVQVERRQSMMFSIDNTPKKNCKNNLLQRGISKMRASTRKSPASSSKIPRSAKSPRIGNCKSPKIASSARKIMNYRPRRKI